MSFMKKMIGAMVIVAFFVLAGNTTKTNAVMIPREKNGMRQPVCVKYQLIDFNTVKLSWEKEKNVFYYLVDFQLQGADRICKRFAVKKDSLTVKKLKANQDYVAIITPIAVKKGKRLCGEPTKIEISTKIETPQVYDRGFDGKKISLDFKTSDTGSKILVYRSDSKDGVYRKVSDKVSYGAFNISNCIPGLTLTPLASIQDTAVKGGKTYYYRVRAYSNMHGVIRYSAFSPVIECSARYETPHIYGEKIKDDGKEVIFRLSSDSYNYNIQLTKDAYISGSSRLNYQVYYAKSQSDEFKPIEEEINIAPGGTIYVKINTNRVLSENDYVRFYLHSEFYPASRTSYMGYDLRYEVGADEFMVWPDIMVA